MARTYNIDVEQMNALLQETKIVYSDIDYQIKNDEATFNCTELYREDTGEIIQGASLNLRSLLLPDYTYHSFALQLLHGYNRNIVLQIEVMPYNPHKPSHRENGVAIFGSHLLKAKTTTAYPRSTDEWKWHQWWKEFHQQANLIYYGSLNPPLLMGDLFS